MTVALSGHLPSFQYLNRLACKEIFKHLQGICDLSNHSCHYTEYEDKPLGNQAFL